MYSSPSMVELATSQPGKSNISVIHPLHTKIRILDYATDTELHTEIRRAEKWKGQIKQQLPSLRNKRIQTQI